MMEFTTSATMLQRPMARTRAVEFASVTEMLVTDEEIVHKEKAAGAEIRSMLSSRLSCIVVYRMQAHPITRRVIPARGDDIAGDVSQQQRANGLLQRFAERCCSCKASTETCCRVNFLWSSFSKMQTACSCETGSAPRVRQPGCRCRSLTL